MSSNTKQVLAITLGSLGLILGIFAMVTAYNAKNAADEDKAVTTQVQTEFAAAQASQDAKESGQASRAEKLINGLSRGEKAVARRLNSNTKGVKQNKKQIRKLKQTTSTLTSRDRELDNELTQFENNTNNQIKNINQSIKQLQKNLNQLRNRVSIDEDLSN